MMIRKKMTLISLSTSLILATFLVATFYVFARNEIKARTIDAFQMKAFIIDRELERLFFERIGDLESLGGRFQLSIKHNFPLDFISESLFQIKKSYRMYNEIYFLSPDKKQIAGTKLPLSPKIFDNDLISRSQLSEGTFFGFSEEENAISFVKSIRTPMGKIMGYLIANVPTQYIKDSIQQYSNLGRYNYLETFHLLRANGQVIYSEHPKGEPAVNLSNIDLKKFGFYEDQDKLWSISQSLETGAINADQRWILVVSAKKDDLYREAKTNAGILALLFLFLISIFSLMTYFLFTSMARPIEKAQIAISAQQEGRSDSIDELVATNDEFGNLIKSLKSMNHKNSQLIDELNQSLKETNRQLELRDEFVSVLAHELRTPLTPVSFQLQFLKRLVDKDKFKDHPYEISLKKVFDVSIKQLKVINSLIDILLEISRIGLGQYSYDFQENTDLIPIFKKNIENYRMYFKVEINEHLPETLKGTWDPVKLEIVFTNLMLNAIHYGGGNKIDIEVSLTTPLTAHFSIRDYGIGIKEEDIERIFKRFERGVSFKNYGGIGLGLYLSRKIIEDHGGKIWVNSKIGEGSIFHVELPIQHKKN